MLYIFFEKFFETLQSIAMRLSLYTDIQIFILLSKFQTDIQSFREHWFISQLSSIF